jgi:pimeloyl-ACP methyl ester carboxylesterase
MIVHPLKACFAPAVAAFLVLSEAATPPRPLPVKNIVLVHGAWVDASGWKPVYEILTQHGYQVTMVQEPLTSLQNDVAATKRILDLQTGPCILVGHSYGGSIITAAGVHPNVVGLVYVAAHAPDVGEDEGALGKRMPSATQAKVFTTPLTAAAWKTKPSWGIVAGADRIINPDLERWYYARAHSHTTQLAGASHSVYESRPKEVAAVIEDAARHAQD